MLVTTILNRIEKHKGFVFGKARMGTDGEGRDCIEVPVRPRKNGRALCSCCGRCGSAYDRLAERRFQYVPLWGLSVVLRYALRRVACPVCGVKVEQVSWSAGKFPVTRSLALFLADWAKRLSWQDVARRFGVNRHQVCESVRYVVDWRLKHRNVSGITTIGVEEIPFGRGQQQLTVVYQLGGTTRRRLFVGKGREGASFASFFDAMGAMWCAEITHVCSDLWKAYRKVVAGRLANAVHILDRFHIVKLLNEAVDKVRREEAAELRKEGLDLLKGLKQVFLKRPEHLTPGQEGQLMALTGKRWRRTVRAYLWKEKFQLFWEYRSPFWAQRYLRRWRQGAMRSRLAPVKKFVRTIRGQEELIMNGFKAKKPYSSGPLRA